jgi:FKBP-type peptidyl-prolyl cis-trans isomerase FklB
MVLKEGTGAKPGPTDTVTVHYTGKLLDGKVFDSSVERKSPAEFGVTEVIPGWVEVLQLMPVGSKYKVYIPYQLGYNDRAAGKIPPFSMLIFEVELLEIVK